MRSPVPLYCRRKRKRDQVSRPFYQRPDRKRLGRPFLLSSPSLSIAGFDTVDVEGGQTLAGDAVAFFLPLFAALEYFPGLRRVLATANFLGASDHCLPVTLLGAHACVTVV